MGKQFKVGMSLFAGDDAIVIRLRPTEYRYAQSLDDDRHLMFDENGELYGVKFLNVSKGIDLDLGNMPDGDMQAICNELDRAGVMIKEHA